MYVNSATACGMSSYLLFFTMNQLPRDGVHIRDLLCTLKTYDKILQSDKEHKRKS